MVESSMVDWTVRYLKIFDIEGKRGKLLAKLRGKFDT
jgi:hypothetical protein